MYLSLVYVAFILPFHGPQIPVGVGIGLAVLAWLVEGKLIDKFKAFFTNKFALLFSLIFLLYLLSGLYSHNSHEAAKNIQLKLSLFLFPLVIATATELTKKHSITILKAFAIGCLVSISACLIHAGYKTITTGENHFLYDKLSIFVQVGYYAMYLTLAAILIVFDWTTRIKRFSLVHLISLIACGAMLVLLSARAQLLAFLFILPLFGFLFLRKRIGQLKAIVLISCGIMGFIAALAFHPQSRARVELAYTDLTRQDADKHSPYLNGINTRFLIWEIGTEIIADNTFIGVGTGDVKDELLSRAKEQNIPSILNKELNFHSQFFQTAVAIGLLGLLAFIASMVVPSLFAWRNKMVVYIAFMLLIVISAITEAIFERQAGVIFFAFFNSLLFFKQPELVEQ